MKIYTYCLSLIVQRDTNDLPNHSFYPRAPLAHEDQGSDQKSTDSAFHSISACAFSEAVRKSACLSGLDAVGHSRHLGNLPIQDILHHTQENVLTGFTYLNHRTKLI
jgi:hypothetical protein